MKKHIYTFCLMIFLTIISCSAQEIFANQRNTWLQKAEEAKPALHETIVHPISIVKAVAVVDLRAFGNAQFPNLQTGHQAAKALQ